MSALLRRTLVVLCLFTLAACQEDGEKPIESNSIFPDLEAEARLKCAKDGGRWGAIPGNASSTCFQNAPDAHESCTRESDCASLCLARSRTCAPTVPFFGCHEVLSSSGVPQTRCSQ